MEKVYCKESKEKYLTKTYSLIYILLTKFNYEI